MKKPPHTTRTKRTVPVFFFKELGRPCFRLQVGVAKISRSHYTCTHVHNHPSKKESKIHHRFLILFGCVILVHKLPNHPFRFSNLFGYVIPLSKLRNHLFRSSNMFNSVILVPKFSFESHQSKQDDLKTLY